MPQSSTDVKDSSSGPIPDAYATLRGELAGILERFAAADERLRRSATIADREAAEAARREAVGEHYGVTRDVADLFLLLLRQALQHRAEALRNYLVKLLAPELDPMAEAIYRLERGHP
jgi:hypothetical protein